MAKLVVFDLDGTLADTLRDLADSINFVRGSFGLAPLSPEEARMCIGGGVQKLVTLALPGGGYDLALGVARMKAYYGEHLTDHTRLFPGVEAALAKLREAGAVLAVVSNKETGQTRRILERNGTAEYFSRIVGGDSEYALKPDPEALLALRRECGSPENQCWMVGDHYTDLEAGRRAAFRRIFCTYGFGERQGETPDFTVDSFSEIPEIILNN